MYKNLLNELSKKMMTVYKLAEKTGISYDNLILKIRGEMEFTKNEMIKISKVLRPEASEEEFEYLFFPEEVI